MTKVVSSEMKDEMCFFDTTHGEKLRIGAEVVERASIRRNPYQGNTEIFITHNLTYNVYVDTAGDNRRR